MGTSQVLATQHVCDGCGSIVYTAASGTAVGYEGKVKRTNPDNSTVTVEFWAHTKRCIAPAIKKAFNKEPAQVEPPRAADLPS